MREEPEKQKETENVTKRGEILKKKITQCKGWFLEISRLRCTSRSERRET